MLTIEIRRHSGEIESAHVEAGRSFLNALFEAGVGRGRLVCGGSGLCGKCRIRFLSSPPTPCAEDFQRLGAEDVEAGWRLACRHAVASPCRIEDPGPPPAMPKPERADGLAVDVGTTRIKWALQRGGEHGAEYAVFNPQMAVGSEIMSRLRYALSSPQGRAHLRESVLRVLRDVVGSSGATALALSANSAMISILLDVPLAGLAYAPYSLPWPGGKVVRLDPGLPPAYVPPLLGPFIGADISAGLAFITAQRPRYPYILADLGTNGEFVLALDEDRYFVCSVPMGPAIEGVGLCCGAPAGAGVLSRAELTPGGLRWGTPNMTGISGTGYMSLLALLLRLGLIGTDGHFRTGVMPLARKVGTRVREHPLGRVFGLEGDIFLAERDIEEFLKAKAGVNVGLRTLVGLAGLGEGDVETVYLAGALGEHSQTEDLVVLGFLPEVWADRVRMAGNTSLAGTLLALRDEGTRRWLAGLPPLVRVESLVERDDFGPAFMKAMRFAWA